MGKVMGMGLCMSKGKEKDMAHWASVGIHGDDKSLLNLKCDDKRLNKICFFQVPIEFHGD